VVTHSSIHVAATQPRHGTPTVRKVSTPKRPTAHSSSVPRHAFGRTAASSSGISLATLLVLGFVALETMLFVVAFLPAHVGPRFVQRFYSVPERRMGVLAAAFTILVGLLIAIYLS
jgi:hypothetical protein